MGRGGGDRAASRIADVESLLAPQTRDRSRLASGTLTALPE